MKLKRKEYTTPAEEKKDFWLGFGLFWLLNIVLYAVLRFVVADDPSLGTVLRLGLKLLGLAPFAINVAVLVLLALTRSQMGIGFLVAFTVAFLLVVLAGVLVAVTCFAASSQAPLDG